MKRGRDRERGLQVRELIDKKLRKKSEVSRDRKG
jgi:hypothetical protein